MVARKAPMTDADKATIRELHAQGVSQTKIAAQIGYNRSAVAMFCKRAGLTFEGKIPAAMAAAALINAKQRQADAHARQLEIIEAEQEQILAVYRGDTTWQTRVKTQGGGERWDTVKFIPSDDKARNASSLASQISGHKNLTPIDSDSRDAAKSMLDKVIESLGLPGEVEPVGDPATEPEAN